MDFRQSLSLSTQPGLLRFQFLAKSRKRVSLGTRLGVQPVEFGLPLRFRRCLQCVERGLLFRCAIERLFNFALQIRPLGGKSFPSALKFRLLRLELTLAPAEFRLLSRQSRLGRCQRRLLRCQFRRIGGGLGSRFFQVVPLCCDGLRFLSSASRVSAIWAS